MTTRRTAQSDRTYEDAQAEAGPLFTNPIAHTDDPATSHQAAATANRVFRMGHSRVVLNAVINNPGLTACELIKPSGLKEYQVRRRLTDLKAAGQIVTARIRKCAVRRTSMVTWATPEHERTKP